MKIYLKKNKGLLLLTIIFSLLASASIVLVTKQYEWLFDVAVTGDTNKFMNLVLRALGSLGVISGLFFIYLINSKKLIKKVLQQIRQHTFEKIIKKDMASFYKENTAEYLSTLTNDINLIEDNWLKPILAICENIGMFITTVMMLLYYSPLLTLAISLTSIVAFIIPSLLGKYLSNKQHLLSKEFSSFTNKIKDIFSGFEVIYSFNLFSHITKSYGIYNQQLSQQKYQTDKFKAINEIIAQTLGIAIQIGTTCLCAYLVMNKQMSIGVLAAVIQLCSRFITPLMLIMNNLALVRSMKPVLYKLEQLSTQDEPTTKQIPHFFQSIDISDLNFAYDDKAMLLKNINLTIEKNKKYVIMGESGCGKTTLIKLLLGYYPQKSGHIYFDGIDMASLDSHHLHAMLSFIQQNVYMFNETMKDNILLHQNYNEEDYQEALVKSGCMNILTKDFSENSLVGENGANLSGGQRQRIAIARALIRKKSFLILDEGTSAVDMQSAYDIEKQLLQEETLTMLAIVHHTSEELLKRYDQIIYMSHGEIIEQGSFIELMDNQSAFYNFYQIKENDIS